MHAALRPYVTAGVALVGASAIAVTPIAATPPDIKIANPEVELTASPFDEYEALFIQSRDNIQGLIAQALAPPPTPADLPFTLDELITGLLAVDANIAAFQQQVGGLSMQVNSLEELTRMLLQAASDRLQAGNFADALDIVLYTALFAGTGVAGFALYPLTLLGPDVQLLAPELAGAIINAAVAPVLSGVAASGGVAQDVLDALEAGNPTEILTDLIAAPAVVANGVLNGADLQTSVFGTVAIPGILTDTTLLSEEGPGPIALPIQLVQFVRGLLTPPEADASSLSQGLQQNSVLPGGSGPATTGKPTRTADPKAEDTGNVLDADKMTNAGSEEPSTGKKDRPRPFGDNSTASQISRDAARPKNLREGVRDGIQGFRDGVRDAVKTFAGRGDNDDAGDHADDTNETP